MGKEVNHGNNISDRLKQSLCRIGTVAMVLVGLLVQSISHMTISTKVQMARGEITVFLRPLRKILDGSNKMISYHVSIFREMRRNNGSPKSSIASRASYAKSMHRSTHPILTKARRNDSRCRVTITNRHEI